MFIDIAGVTKTYRTGDVAFRALDGVKVEMDAGEIGVLLGPSGSGKSTLMNIAGGVDRADSGSVVIDGQDIAAFSDEQLTEYRRHHVGFVFQFYNLIPNLTVYENVELVAHISPSAMQVDEVLEAVGLAEQDRKFPRELSGGQQQRVSIARAIVKKPKLLLCDEPTGALDFDSSKAILKLIGNVNRDYGTTVLIITHNEAIGGMAHRIYRMRSGQIAHASENRERIDPERMEW